MDLRVVATTTGLVGGATWLTNAFVDASVLHWGGAVLLLVALAAAGAGLVNKSTAWLRAIVTVGLAALTWSVLEVVRDSADDLLVDGLAGAVAVLVSVVAFLRRPHAGSHRT